MRMGTAGAAAYGTVSIGATAGVIVDGTTLRQSVVVQNVHATQVLYIGSDSSVATTTGLRVNPGETIVIDDYNGPLYGVASGAATDVRYFESGA